ncbi:Lead, cadmium, zinc and mercury transporting ATPase [Rhodococcus aetherivorans]|uniref:Lead, cadmium, zinc and mercury transporting ATPase n=1 Tax=Rhodococcus aetherivorans TaxID=191292 RepID=A0ABQ0YNW3_9NOCA|nr:hypothetical protein RR21198_4139 [Rhodococcus rhodochrous ATCC 21198]GES38203.1 Lead, cadmium, zinc and mercury transporting ATPase [Rhodococcus aetherivorans]
MSDACGCGHAEPRLPGEDEDAPEKLWQITEIRAAAPRASCWWRP